MDPRIVDVLRDALHGAAGALLVAPRVVLASAPDIVQFDSADCHFLGLMSTRNAGRPAHEVPVTVARTTSLVTACFLIDRARWLGGPLFDEWFGFNYEDHDFGVRASVRGHDLLVAPAATVLHGSGTANLSYREGGPVPTQRVFFLLRNRWSILTKAYALRSLLLLAPVLLCFELFQFAGVASKGWAAQWRAALRSWWRELPRLLQDRRDLQRARRRRDRDILRAGPLPLTAAVNQGVLQRLAIGAMQCIANAWWRLVRPVL
jgi:GT2 family glycosyltransferase